VALGPIPDALFPFVIGIAEYIARAIADAFHVTNAKVERTIQFLAYLLVICPLLLIAAAALAAVVTWLI